MDRICVVDTSIPAYADPTARECFVMVGASAEALEAGVQQLAGVSTVAVIANVGMTLVLLGVVCLGRFRGSR